MYFLVGAAVMLSMSNEILEDVSLMQVHFLFKELNGWISLIFMGKSQTNNFDIHMQLLCSLNDKRVPIA